MINLYIFLISFVFLNSCGDAINEAGIIAQDTNDLNVTNNTDNINNANNSLEQEIEIKIENQTIIETIEFNSENPSKKIQFYNISESELIISNISIENNDAFFLDTSQTDFLLNPGDPTSFYITYNY